ncbi:MAG: hypothetical protein VYA39_03170 [Candidatus Thermoplasmatota archaeon]|nr:hypothetical protein [Candidatus Thermoplasmatota archaeon]
MEEDEPLRVYVGKGRSSYSGMVLDSIFTYLLRAVVAIVIIGIFLMMIPLL